MNRMCRKILITLFLAALMILTVSIALAATGTVTVNSLVLREEASTKSDALRTLSKGEQVTIVYKDGSWYKVKYGRYTGFVMTRYIKAEGDVPTKGETETMRLGDSGSDVYALQKRLKELGYLTGKADSVFGKQTEEAVKAFQKRNGLTADGVVGETTLKKLNSSSAKKAADSTSGSTPVTDDGTLRMGNSGSAVRALQTRLKELGYYRGSVDGVYGTGTVSAVKAFQKRNSLTADGVAGASTLTKLNSSSAKKAQDDDDDKDDQDVQDDGTLRVGSRGSAVRTLQQKLKSLGYYKGSVDGVYGTSTVNAVRAFQQRNKLTVDGVAGESTLKKLYSSSAKKADDDDDDKDEDDDALRVGASGAAVKALQTRLKELGYYTGTIDGSYGSKTVAAVKAFQKRNGLTQDGVAGDSTLKKLNSSSAKKAQDDDKDDEDAGSSDGTLRPGDKGNDVKDMQYRLKELGYYNGSRDGVYGTGTRAAVKAFQTRNGLTADGVAGSATLKKLYSSSAKKAQQDTDEDEDEGKLSTSNPLKPGDTGANIKALQRRLKELGYYTGSIDGSYGYSTRKAVIAFQKNNALSQDGIAGASTIKKLISSSAKAADDVKEGTYVTERLDWFNGGSSRIPRGATFQVKDCKTGLIFTAKRQAGGYHLDAEPLTAADTAILKRINGGSFTYHRRPMLLLYNGRVYACSIYSEPHGADTIPSNNFDGQFCLHFYGSKTHGTDRVDEDHKKCEEQALRYTW